MIFHRTQQSGATTIGSFLRSVILVVLVAVALAQKDVVSNSNNTTNNNGTTSSNNNQNSSSQPAAAAVVDDNDYGVPNERRDPEYYRYRQPPWGISSYGNIVSDNNYSSNYFAAGGAVLDVVRPGWSWNSHRQEQLVAPFCYDSIPKYVWGCPYDAVKDHCQSVLQGTPAYGDRFCLTNQPHTVIGPVCWNGTCYQEETRQACSLVDKGWFLGSTPSYFGIPTTDIVLESNDEAWCVVPGEDHTLFGPACYGSKCYTTELIEACNALQGTNFADRYCLLKDKSYTVVGPVCHPVSGPVENATVCYGEETAQVCAELGGTSVGDIFCLLKSGDYSVLGPFCASGPTDSSGMIYAHCVSPEDGKAACQALSGRSIGNGTFCILNDSDYHLIGPTCDHGRGCKLFGYGDDLEINNSCRTRFGGQVVGGYFCIVRGDYTVIGPAQYGGLDYGGGDTMSAKNVQEQTVHELFGSWYVLNGTYSVYGPTCYGSFCYQGQCLEAGGSLIDSIFCVMKMESSSAAAMLSGPVSFWWWPRSRMAMAVAIVGGVSVLWY